MIPRLSKCELDQLRQIYRLATWDGNLISKTARNSLRDKCLIRYTETPGRKSDDEAARMGGWVTTWFGWFAFVSLYQFGFMRDISVAVTVPFSIPEIDHEIQSMLDKQHRRLSEKSREKLAKEFDAISSCSVRDTGITFRGRRILIEGATDDLIRQFGNVAVRPQYVIFNPGADN